MTDVQSLHCPNCGAAADPQSTRCPYCRARLATVSCPKCFALMFAGSTFCPACGARFSKTAPEPTSSKCPACHERLERVGLGDVSLLQCSGCDGLWVGADDFERICVDRESQAAVLDHPWPRQPDPARRPSIHYRPCVICGKMMNRVNFGRISGTVIDVCKAHGVFLDSGELHAITAFIMHGGLDRARQKEKEDLDEERRRLEELRSQVETRSAVADWHHRSEISDRLLQVRRLLKGE